MRKFFALIISILCFLTIFSLTDKVEVVAADYYASTQNLEGKALLNELATISQKNHTYYTSYGELRYNYAPDQDPNNSANLLDFYSKISINAAWDGGTTWNREHVWPQSLSGGLYGTTGAGADIHHIRPTISSINSSRGNQLFTDFDMIKANGSEKKYNGTLVAYTNGDYWEPIDDVKGDTARIVLYMYMHYSKEVDANKSFSYAGNLSLTNIVYSDSGLDGALEILATWNKMDPVDTFEANRNEECASVTHVRNPFIDHPEFVDLIWPTNASDSTYKVTYNYGNAIFDYTDNTEYKLGSQVTKPTKDPVLADYEFAGWYTDSSYTTKWDFDNDVIRGNVVLYAKFNKVIDEFADVFESSKIMSQLTFNAISNGASNEKTSGTVTISGSTSGPGTLNPDNYNLADYFTFDTNLFDVIYTKNSANYSYINGSGEIRLYPGSGNGSSINITAKDGVVIKNVTYTSSGSTPTVTIASDGSSAKIHNTINATSKNQVKITEIKISYELNTSSESFTIVDGSLKLKYCLELTEAQYNLYLLDSAGLKLYINNEEVAYYVYKVNGTYRLNYEIEVSDLNKVYTPKFVFNNTEKTITGYSAKTLAKYYLNNLGSSELVKQYKNCLTELAN